jgi:two-component system phosphate regulon sensor histidine kinase PhoR
MNLRLRQKLADRADPRPDGPRSGVSGLEVVAGIAHDLRSPLATITTSAELLEQEVDSITSSHLINVIQRQVQRLQLMIQDLSEYAGFESGRVVLHPGTVDLAKLVEETCADLQEFDSSHNLVFQIPATAVRIRGDHDKLRRVLENLLRNAFKYSPNGTTVIVRLRTVISQEALIEVEDEGPGVPVDMREKIFEPFVRLDNGRNAGQGLGLHVVKLLATAHRGRVWVEAAPSGSARFCVLLPLQAAAIPD